MAYASHMATFADHFRVIAPDTRGCGKTPHGGGATSYDQLADDVVAMIDALELRNVPTDAGRQPEATEADPDDAARFFA